MHDWRVRLQASSGKPARLQFRCSDVSALADNMKGENMDNYISRKWLLECIEEGWIKLDTESDTNRMIHLIRDTAPSADVQPVRHGKWVMTWHNLFRAKLPVCSYCDSYGVYKTKYCPNCGARMDG